MRYDEERRVILVTVREMVEISRRGISRTLPLDEDEPGHLTPSRRGRDIGGACGRGISLRYPFVASQYHFELIGEADGIEGEELTHIASISSNPEKPRSEEEKQARGEGYILAYIYSMTEGYESVTLNTVYVNESSGDVATRVEKIGINELEKFFNRCVGEIEIYARPEIERVTVRLPSMRALRFPYSKIREGQSDLIHAVHRALTRGGSLYASAPTGTGKTVSVLYPAIRLLGEGKGEKVFYLTPKTTTAEVARECLNRFADTGAVIRAIVLTSKEKSCPVSMVCRDSISDCRLGRNNATKDAVIKLYGLEKTVIGIDDVLPIAKEHAVCPYEVELAYSELCDVVIGDINYLFDPRAYIRRFFEGSGDYFFLIDEAHNLGERAREMYSAELSPARLVSFSHSGYVAAESDVATKLPEYARDIESVLMPLIKDELREGKDGEQIGATHLSEVPSELYQILEAILALFEEEIGRSYKWDDPEKNKRRRTLRDMYYEVKRVYDTMLAFDSLYRMFIFYEGGVTRFKLYAVDPSGRIRERLSHGRGAVFFSATLSPIEYYRTLLGGDSTSEVMETDSPFANESLSVSIIDKVSTRYSERDKTLPAVARIIAATLSARRGNYMVFLPSFEYLSAAAGAFRAAYPKIRVLEQKKGMTEAERREFLREFEAESDSYLVGFCVMGGLYAEGVDLVGDKLIGAIVVSIGMPSLSYERESIAEYYEEKLEAGALYAYVYPGMNKVFQAAGRVIREENDRGVIILIDDRFADPIYKKSIPNLWRGMEYISDAKSLNERIREFWAGVDKERGKTK